MGIQLRKKPQTCPNSREMKDELVIPAVEFSEISGSVGRVILVTSFVGRIILLTSFADSAYIL